MAEEGLIYKVCGSGTFFNKEVSLSYNMNLGTQSKKIGLVLQGWDRSANSSLIEGIHSDNEKFVRVIQKFLKSLPKCTAIVCCNCMIYRLVRKTLQELGKQVPKDYSLVCFDYSQNDWEEEGIVCSIHPGYEMGVQAAKCLMKMLSDKDCGDSGKSRVVSSEIYYGNSICEANTGKSD